MFWMGLLMRPPCRSEPVLPLLLIRPVSVEILSWTLHLRQIWSTRDVSFGTLSMAPTTSRTPVPMARHRPTTVCCSWDWTGLWAGHSFELWAALQRDGTALTEVCGGTLPHFPHLRTGRLSISQTGSCLLLQTYVGSSN